MPKSLSAIIIVTLTVILALNSCSTRLAPEPTWIAHPGSSQGITTPFDEAVEQLAVDAHGNLIKAGTQLNRFGKRNKTLWISKHHSNGAQLWKLALDLDGIEDSLHSLLPDGQSVRLVASSSSGSYLVTLNADGNQHRVQPLPGTIRTGIIDAMGLLLAGDRVIRVNRDDSIQTLGQSDVLYAHAMRLNDETTVLVSDSEVSYWKADQRLLSTALPGQHHERRLSPAVVPSPNGELFVATASLGTNAVELHKLNTKGEHVWTRQWQLAVQPNDKPHLVMTPAANLLLLIPSHQGRLVQAIDSSNGERYVSRTLPDNNIIRSVVSAGDRFYVFGGDSLQTLNSEAQLIAELSLPGMTPMTTGAAVKHNGHLIIANSYVDSMRQLRAYSASYAIN